VPDNPRTGVTKAYRYDPGPRIEDTVRFSRLHQPAAATEVVLTPHVREIMLNKASLSR
jgi:hypothetical protein